VIAYDDVHVPNGKVIVRDPLDLGLSIKSCTAAGTSGGCFCPAGSKPLSMGFICPSGTHFYYTGWHEKSAAGEFGYRALCMNMFNKATNWANDMQLLCATLQQPSWPNVPSNPSW